MFESGTHSIPRRIVSLAQPRVRPIVRGKAHANTEFGSKLHISLVEGYARIERLDFEPFNESEDLWRAVARYRERYGCYPERILADGHEDFAAIACLTWYAGLRIHECFRIDTAIAAQVLRENAITIKGKGGKIRTVPINESISIELKICWLSHPGVTSCLSPTACPPTSPLPGSSSTSIRCVLKFRTRVPLVP